MKKLLAIFILFLQTFIISSCASQVNILKSLTTAKKSVVKVEAHVRMTPCNEASQECEGYNLYATGTGSVVLYDRKKVILTAAHICKQDEFGLFVESAGGDILFKIIDRDHKEYVVRVLKYNIDSDICLLMSDVNLEIPFLKMSPKKPEYAEIIYNLAGPLGVINGEMVPVYQGNYFGDIGGRSFYGLPAIGGSSGSPIINAKGELVGVLHSVHAHFHHIALSASYANLWNFLSIANSRTLLFQN